MCLRNAFVLHFLAHVALAFAVDVEVIQIKAIGNTGDKYRLTGRCEYTVTERPIEVGEARFTIQLNRESSKFKSNQATELSTDGTSYRLSNSKLIKNKKYRVNFTCEYLYNETEKRCFPVGTCSPLETETTSTSTTATSTTTGPMSPTNLFQNSDMELSFTDNWYCRTDCTIETSTDSFTGAQSAKITNRDRTFKGLAQDVNLTAGLRYSLSGYIKLLNTETGEMYHAVTLVLSWENDQGNKEYLQFGTNKMVQPGIWTEIGAVMKIPTGYTSFTLYFKVSGATADYLVDHMVLTEVPDLANWRTKAEESIERIRKADFTIRVDSASALPANLTIEVNQTRHDFAFGSAVGATQIVDPDPTLQKYQAFFYDNFEWAVLENALKWKLMEKVEGTIDYDRPTKAINALRDRGIKIRGHCVFWAVEDKCPEWIKPFNQSELLQAMTTRMNGVIGNTTGLLEHWDVNNENLHGDFFERGTGDANITMQIFRDVHALDPTVKLFLNDFGIIAPRYNQMATAMKEQAKTFRAAGVPIHGVGIQSHIIPSDVDPTAMKMRLDKVAEAGVPIWITELSVEETDENIKAAALEDALTLYFAYPAVQGILLWGFWDGKIFEPSASLVNGPDLTPNAAGRAYQTLYHQTWRTNEARDVTDTSPIQMRGFKGTYTVNLKQNGVLLNSEMFVLDDAGAEVTLSVP